jgi:acetyl-CoA synthetase
MEDLLREIYSDERVVPPLFKYKTISLAQYLWIYKDSLRPEFWAGEAAQLLWERRWTKVLEGEPPAVRWFPDGLLSPYRNIVGRHEGTWIWEKPALIWRGEEGVTRVLTYSDLDGMAKSYSGVLKALGVDKGDWVMFYAPPTPEIVALMLAAVRLGAPVEPVFTGFGYGDLAARVDDTKPKLLVTVDAFPRRGKPIKVKETVDKALGLAKWRPKVLVVERMGVDVKLVEGRDHRLEDVRAEPAEEAVVESTHPLFGLHVGYDGGLGLVVHGVGGYLTQTYATTRWMGLRPRDTYFCTVLPGWITGVTYVLFGPLMVGSTVVVYEGGPDYPHWDVWWSVIEDYAVTVFLTTVGALRVLSRQDPELLKGHNLDTLKLILTTAEPMEVKYWKWAYHYVGTGTVSSIDSLPEKLSGRIPVIHMFIQTELGTFATGSLPNYTFVPIAPGSVGPHARLSHRRGGRGRQLSEGEAGVAGGEVALARHARPIPAVVRREVEKRRLLRRRLRSDDGRHEHIPPGEVRHGDEDKRLPHNAGGFGKSRRGHPRRQEGRGHRSQGLAEVRDACGGVHRRRPARGAEEED